MAYVLRKVGTEVIESLEGDDFGGVQVVYSTPSEEAAAEVIRAQTQIVKKPYLYPEYQAAALALFDRVIGIEFEGQDHFIIEKDAARKRVTKESMAVLRPLAGALCDLAQRILGIDRKEEKN